MAASSGLAPSFTLKSHVHGVGLAFSSSSLVRFRLHGGAIVTITRRSSLNLRRSGASMVSPRCKAGFDDAALNSLFSSSDFADRYTRERCSIVVIGLCGPSTPLEHREKLAIVESEWSRAIEELCKLDHIEEAAVLCTCSRMEIYVLALCQDRGVSQVTDWISKSSGVPVSEIFKHRVLLYNKDAVEHLFEVSSGLDSSVLGEGQILAQVKQVVRSGHGVAGFGMMISAMFMSAIGVGERVRRETSVAARDVSVSSAAVELALMKISESSSLAMARMLVVGSGNMGKLVIKHLVARGCKKIVVVTCSELSLAVIRTKMKKEGVDIIYKPLSEMYDCAAAADVIFTCTTSKKPLFLKQDVEKLPPGSRLFIDISVPRNVGSCVANLLGTNRVYNVDDIKQAMEDAASANKEDRLREVIKAQLIIDEKTKLFEDWRDSFATAPTAEKLRESLEEIRIAWLEKHLSEFGDGITEPQRKAIEDYSWGRINKRLNNLHALITRIKLETVHG